MLLALESGADVVTGNKALLATHGPELFARRRAGRRAAELRGRRRRRDPDHPPAARQPRRRPRAPHPRHRERHHELRPRPDGRGGRLGFDEALAEATRLGYAEADPTGDVSGADAAQKAAILAGLAFHTTVPLEKVWVEGITGVTAEQVRSARAAGQVVKLLAICERITAPDGTEGVSARVHPALLPRTHPLAAVRGANNAVFVQAESAGNLMFYGAGAGGPETASAVLGDLVSAARRHVIGGPGLIGSAGADLPVLDHGVVETRYQITLAVRDEPGVLARLAGIVSERGVSIETVEQSRAGSDGTASLVVGTHRAREAALAATVEALRDAAEVEAVLGVLRVEGE